MTDLFIAVGILAALAAGLFALALKAGRRMSVMLALAAIAVAILHFFFLYDNPLLARWVPVSSIVVLGNWIPLVCATLAALAWRHLRLGPAVKGGLAALLVLVSFYHACDWLFWPVAPGRDHWRDGVCIQSTEATCAPAAAATLLHAYGIQASEREMTRLCLTNALGTSSLGLYRGLCRSTLDTPYAVEFVRDPSERPVADQAPPLLLSVRLSREQIARLNCARTWRVPPGIPHAVVFFGVDDEGLATVGDPLVGRVRWAREVLETGYQGIALRLVRR